MADSDNLPLEWDEVDVNEGEDVSAEDQAGSDDISDKRLIGKALCKITKVFPIEKNITAYSCYAIVLEHTIVDVLEANMPVMDEAGKQLVRNGGPVFKVRVLTDGEKVKLNKEYVGKFLGSDEVFMFHPSEKPNMKRRRLFIAKNAQIMDTKAASLTMGAWKLAEGKMVIVTAIANRWKDRETQEWRESGTKIAWDGYALAGLKEEAPGKGAASVEENEEYDDI